ncbi:MAG: hypothetical protein Q4D56_14025, partial [Bacteroides sp.]|nr:hypothetical protein [Bacteroides sp.]
VAAPKANANAASIRFICINYINNMCGVIFNFVILCKDIPFIVHTQTLSALIFINFHAHSCKQRGYAKRNKH